MKIITFSNPKAGPIQAMRRRIPILEGYYYRGESLKELYTEQAYLDHPLALNLNNVETPIPYYRGYYCDDIVSMAASLTYPEVVITKLKSKLNTELKFNSCSPSARQHLLFDVYYPEFLMDFYSDLFRYRIHPRRLGASVHRLWLPFPSTLFRLLRK